MVLSRLERRRRRAAVAKKHLHTPEVHAKLKKPKTEEHKQKLSKAVKAAIARKKAEQNKKDD